MIYTRPDRSASHHRRAIEEALNRHHLYQLTAVSDNFTSPGHSIRDKQLIPLEVNSHRDDIRKVREGFFLSKAMNRRDKTYIYKFPTIVFHHQSHFIFNFVLF